MVKDYKRLHHLDFAEPDLDDSDGGYSDYQMSDHDGDDPARLQNDSKSLLPGDLLLNLIFLKFSSMKLSSQ